MLHDAIWFSSGTRLRTTFATVDVHIPALEGFVRDAAAALARGETVATAARSAARRHPQAARAFELDQGDLETSFALSDSLTFPTETLPQEISFEHGSDRIALRLDTFLARDTRAFLELCASGQSSATDVHDAIEEPLDGLLDALLENEMLVVRPPPSPLGAASEHPGVTRLQHAGLLYRGRSTGVLVDPHLHSFYEPERIRRSFSRPQFEGLVDAVVVSHGHGDHWHLPTLMMFPRDTPIVVPKVPRPSMLSPDFERTLRTLGFTNVVPLAWYGPPLTIGDLEIHALPFYGEQPLVHERPRHPDLRNYGNTYVVSHDSYTSWFLIDAGNDWAGRMVDVAYEVRERFGRIDLLLSNLRPFAIRDPLYITGGHYWLALTPDQLRRFPSMANDVMTLGPDGVAEVCQIVEARKFLPYAHWWGDIGGPPDEDERLLADELRSRLTVHGAATEVVPWAIGATYLTTSREGDLVMPLASSH